jgi:hypothetical protein
MNYRKREYNMKKETKDLLERMRASFDTEFTNADKLAMSGNCNGTCFLFDIYAKKHPEDIELDTDDLTDEELDEFIYSFQDEVEEVESKYTDEEFEAIMNEYHAPKNDDEKFKQIVTMQVYAAPEFRPELTNEDKEFIINYFRDMPAEEFDADCHDVAEFKDDYKLVTGLDNATDVYFRADDENLVRKFDRFATVIYNLCDAECAGFEYLFYLLNLCKIQYKLAVI